MSDAAAAFCCYCNTVREIGHKCLSPSPSLVERLKEPYQRLLAVETSHPDYVVAAERELFTALRNALPEILIALERVGELEKRCELMASVATEAQESIAAHDLRAEAAEQRVGELEAALIRLCDLKRMKIALETQSGPTLNLPGGIVERVAIERYYEANKEAAWQEAFVRTEGRK